MSAYNYEAGPRGGFRADPEEREEKEAKRIATRGRGRTEGDPREMTGFRCRCRTHDVALWRAKKEESEAERSARGGGSCSR